MIDVRTLLKTGIAQLRDANVPSFTLAAELLLLHALGRNKTWLYAHPDEPVSERDAQHFKEMIVRRGVGEPTQYIIGKQEFWGLEFEVTPDVLIPRPETEHVIEVALDRLALHEIRVGRPQITTGKGLLAADIGTGSGCIAIALAKELPEAHFVATDISAVALKVAHRNAQCYGVENRVRFVRANLLDQLGDFDSPLVHADEPTAIRSPRHRESRSPLSFDLIVSNPPYVSRREAATLPREVREHEPESALYGGEEGYEFYAALVARAGTHLKPGGILVLELGYNSLPAVEPLLDATGWTKVGVTDDLAGIPRVIAAERL
jgi:release factor glutamine methyltransferase